MPLKTQLRFGFILMVLPLLGDVYRLALFSASMFVSGLVSGITMSIGTFLITYMYKAASVARVCCLPTPSAAAGMIFLMVAAFLLARSIEWYWVYACIGLDLRCHFILTFGCEFPVLAKAQQDNQPVVKENGHRRVVPRNCGAVLHPRSTGLYLPGTGVCQDPGMSLARWR